MLMFASANSTPPQGVFLTLLSLCDWEMNVTSNETILSPSEEKDNSSSSASTYKRNHAQRHAQAPLPWSQPVVSCLCGCGAALARAAQRRRVCLTARQSPHAGLAHLCGQRETRQLSNQGGNGSASFRRLRALWEKVADTSLPDWGIHVN